MYLANRRKAFTNNPTVLMLHANGTNGSTTFIDSCGGHNVTALGDAQISTAQSVFGGSSALFDGVNDQLRVSKNNDFNFGSEDWTVELRVRFNSLAGGSKQLLIWGYDAGVSDRSWIIAYQTGTSELALYQSSDGSTNDGNALRSWTPSIDTWYHVAVAREGANVRLFVDGTQLGSDATAVNLFNNTNLDLYIASDVDTNEEFNGYMDEIRIVKGTAVYTGNFTVPVSEFSSCNL